MARSAWASRSLGEAPVLGAGGHAHTHGHAKRAVQLGKLEGGVAELLSQAIEDLIAVLLIALQEDNAEFLAPASSKYVGIAQTFLKKRGKGEPERNRRRRGRGCR